MRQLVVVIAALMPPVHIDMTRSALFIPSSTKAIIFVVVAQFLLIYIDEMCVTTATTTSRKRNENENENTSNNGNNNNNNRKLRSRRLCLLSYHAQLDNFHLPKRPGRPERKREKERARERGKAGAFSAAEPGRVFCVFFFLFYFGF